jgi:hypothetical protein
MIPTSWLVGCRVGLSVADEIGLDARAWPPAVAQWSPNPSSFLSGGGKENSFSSWPSPHVLVY